VQIFHQGDLLVTIFSSIYTRVSPSGQLFTLINCFLSQGVFIPKLPTYLPTSTVTAVSMYNLAFSQFSFGFVPPLFPEDNPWGEVSGILSEVVTCVNFLSPNQQCQNIDGNSKRGPRLMAGLIFYFLSSFLFPNI